MSKVTWEELHELTNMKEIRAKILAGEDEAMELALDASMVFQELGDSHFVVYMYGLFNNRTKFMDAMNNIRKPTQMAEFLYNALAKDELRDLIVVLIGTAIDE